VKQNLKFFFKSDLYLTYILCFPLSPVLPFAIFVNLVPHFSSSGFPFSFPPPTLFHSSLLPFLGVLLRLDHVFATVQLILRRSAWLRPLATNYQLISQTINLHSTCKILTYAYRSCMLPDKTLCKFYVSQ